LDGRETILYNTVQESANRMPRNSGSRSYKIMGGVNQNGEKSNKLVMRRSRQKQYLSGSPRHGKEGSKGR